MPTQKEGMPAPLAVLIQPHHVSRYIQTAVILLMMFELPPVAVVWIQVDTVIAGAVSKVVESGT